MFLITAASVNTHLAEETDLGHVTKAEPLGAKLAVWLQWRQHPLVWQVLEQETHVLPPQFLHTSALK